MRHRTQKQIQNGRNKIHKADFSVEFAEISRMQNNVKSVKHFD